MDRDHPFVQVVVESFKIALLGIGVKCPPSKMDLVRAFAAYLEKHQGRRVVGHRSPQDIGVKLLADSFAYRLLALPALGHVLDMGSGNGWPGLAFEGQCSTTFLDSRLGACDFIQGFLAEAKIGDAEILLGRAETLAHERHRQRYDTVVSRAMAHPGQALELASGLTKTGGRIILWLGPLQRWVEEQRGFIPELGLERKEVLPYNLSPGDKRYLAFFTKVSPLEENYPRSIVAIRRSPVIGGR